MMCSLKTESSFCAVIDVPLNTAALCRCSCTAASCDATKSIISLKTLNFLSAHFHHGRARAALKHRTFHLTCACFGQPPCPSDPCPVAFIKLSINIHPFKHDEMQSIFHVVLTCSCLSTFSAKCFKTALPDWIHTGSVL